MAKSKNQPKLELLKAEELAKQQREISKKLFDTFNYRNDPINYLKE